MQLKKDEFFYKNILKLLDFQTLVLKMSIFEIELIDVMSYFLEFKIKNCQLNNLNEIFDIIFSISENKIIEYLNIKSTTNKNLKLDDFSNWF